MRENDQTTNSHSKLSMRARCHSSEILTMTNPYEPPTTSEPITPAELRFYEAGWWPIAILGIVVGGAVGGLISGFQYEAASFVFPAYAWVAATILLVFMIRDSVLTVKGKVLCALLLPIPAYILYVPVCVLSSIGTMPVLGEFNYGPSTAAAVVASAFAFFVVLMLIAAIVRAIYRVPNHETATNVDV